MFYFLQNLTKWPVQLTAAYSSLATQVMFCSTWTGCAAETFSQMSPSWWIDSSFVHTRLCSWLAGVCLFELTYSTPTPVWRWSDSPADFCLSLSNGFVAAVGCFTPSLLTPTSAALMLSVWTRRWTQKALRSCWSLCTPLVWRWRRVSSWPSWTQPSTYRWTTLWTPAIDSSSPGW